MGHQHLIQLHKVSKVYREKPVAGVKDIDLTIGKGEIVVIAGESGSGKSTLLRLITGLVTPDSGRVLFNQEEVRGPEARLIPGHEAMKFVAQDFNLNIYAKVYDNIAGQLPNTNLKGKQRKTFEVMEFLKIDHLSDKRVSDLSGGEQQRVAIGRAIVTEPEVLLMDEPFSQIDAVLKSDLRADIKRMSDYLGITVVLVSHDPLDGLSLAKKMVVLKDGVVVEQGDPRQLYYSPESVYTARLLGNCNVISREDAGLLGINTRKNFVLIYPEWIRVESEGSPANGYLFKESFFKGFYDELLLEKNGVVLRALHPDSVKYKKYDKVFVKISRYLEI